MALTKKDLAEVINKKIGIPKTESSKLVDSFFEEIKLGIKNKNIVKLTHFGTFRARNKTERVGRNPKTKESVVITERKIVTFNSTAKLKSKINKKSV